MKRVPRQQQLLLKFSRPSGLDELEIKPFVRSINFIANNRVTTRREMDPNLVSAASMRNGSDQTELAVAGASRFNKAPFDTKFGLRCRSRRMNRLLQPDG